MAQRTQVRGVEDPGGAHTDGRVADQGDGARQRGVLFREADAARRQRAVVRAVVRLVYDPARVHTVGFQRAPQMTEQWGVYGHFCIRLPDGLILCVCSELVNRLS